MKRLNVKQLIPYLWIIIFVFIILLPQIHHHFFLSGMDYYFHMSRTYEAAMQIKTGHFSYFLSLFSWQRNARIINAMYGPLGGYFSGLILLLTRTWLNWEIAFDAIVILIAGISMHQLNRYWHVKPVIDILITVLYMISPAVYNFVFFQSFYSVGAAFIPWVFLAGSRIADGKFRISKLTTIMIVIAEVHLLTLAVSTIILAFFAVPALIIRRNRMMILKKLVISAFLTLILTVNVWGTVLGVMLSNRNHILLTYPNMGPLDGNPFNTIRKTYSSTSIWQSPSIIGPFILLIIVIASILWLLKIMHNSLSLNVTVILGLVFLWMSSNYFPWLTLQKKMPVVDTLVQFPSRFLSIGLVAMYIALGKLITTHHKMIWIPAIIVLLLTISNLEINNYKTTMARGRTFYSNAVIDWRSMGWNHKHSTNRIRRSLITPQTGQFINVIEKAIPDYLPTSVKYTDQNPKEYKRLNPYKLVDQQLFFHRYPTFHFRVAIKHRTEEYISIKSLKKQRVRLPFVKYRHTIVNLNHHQINPKISKVGAMWIPLNRGRNSVTLYYQPSLKYRVALIISLIAWLLMLITIIIRHFKVKLRLRPKRIN